MANKEHNTITDPEIHEPKGVSTALVGQVYVANGSGSGTWQIPQGNSTQVVNSISDFPTPAGGVITLADDTTYVLGAAMSTADRFQMGDNTAITGNIYHNTLTYTGSGSMFTGVDVTSTFVNARFNCASGEVFNFEDTVGGIKSFFAQQVIVENCAKWGTFDDMLLWEQNSTSCLNAGDGVTFLGTNNLIFSASKFALASTDVAFVGLDLGTSVAQTIEFENVILNGVSGATGISGAAANANVPVGAVATVDRCEFQGALTPLSGITTDDVRWRFAGNTPNVKDTQPDAMVSINGNATATTISVATTPVLAAGTWTDERSSHFTNTTGGRITYNGERSLTTPIQVTATVDVASGTNKTVRVYIAKNGTVYTNSGISALVDAGSPISLVSLWQDSLAENDYLEVFVANDTDTVDVTLVDAVFLAR
jgi:hypothetical protein